MGGHNSGVTAPPPKTRVLEAWSPESIWKVSEALKGGNSVRLCLQQNYGTLVSSTASFLLLSSKVTTFAVYLSSGLKASGPPI